MFKFLKIYADFAHNHRSRFIKSLIFSFLQVGMMNFPLLIFVYSLDLIRRQALNPATIIKVTAILIGVFILRIIFLHLFHRYQTFVSYDIGRDERVKIGDHFRRLPLGFFSEGNLGRVSAVLSQDLNFFEEHSMNSVAELINAISMLLIGHIFLLFLDVRLALCSIAICLIGMAAFKWILNMCMEESALRQKQHQSLTTSFLEFLLGISIVKAFPHNNRIIERLQQTISKTKDQSIHYEVRLSLPVIIYRCVFAIGSGLLTYLAMNFFAVGELSFFYAVGVAVFAFYIYLPLEALSSTAAMIGIVQANIDRFKDLIETPVIDADGKEITVENHDVEFDDVSFAYEKRQGVLHNINATFPQGTMTALVGPSGSGKSTMANLIMRFWDTDSGSIRLGGHPLKEMTCDSVLNEMAAVFQRVYLFNDTIRNNILFGDPEATEEEMIAAAKVAACHNFIMQLPEGYDTPISAGGTSLSGGEKQRISIARAILKDAPIVILDEATSAMDPDNEHHIQAALNALIKDKTVVVIAHRLHTIVQADQILVLDQGKIVERGRHDELLANEGLYKHLWQKRQLASSWQIGKDMT